MQRDFDREANELEAGFARKIVACRRGCSPDVIAANRNRPPLADMSKQVENNPEFVERRTLVRNKLAQIEIQSQLMEVALLARNWGQFRASAETLAQLVDFVPSQALLRTSIRAQLVPPTSGDEEFAKVLGDLAREIRRLKSLHNGS